MDEQRACDPGEDAVIDIDAVTKSSTCQGIVVSEENETSTYFERTDLDTYANMVVLDRNCHVVNYSGKTAEVHPFSPNHEALKVPIVDAVIQYDDLYSGETFMLVCKEAIYVPAMKHNLIPPFLTKEKGLVFDNLPKLKSLNPTKHHYSTHFPDVNLQMPLMLYGICSCFPSKKPLIGVLNDHDDKILFLTTYNVNTHNKIYSENERAMLDHEVNMIEKEDRRSYIMDAVVVTERMKCAAFVGK